MPGKAGIFDRRRRLGDAAGENQSPRPRRPRIGHPRALAQHDVQVGFHCFMVTFLQQDSLQSKERLGSDRRRRRPTNGRRRPLLGRRRRPGHRRRPSLPALPLHLRSGTSIHPYARRRSPLTMFARPLRRLHHHGKSTWNGFLVMTSLPTALSIDRKRVGRGVTNNWQRSLIWDVSTDVISHFPLTKKTERAPPPGYRRTGTHQKKKSLHFLLKLDGNH